MPKLKQLFSGPQSTYSLKFIKIHPLTDRVILFIKRQFLGAFKHPKHTLVPVMIIIIHQSLLSKDQDRRHGVNWGGHVHCTHHFARRRS